MAEQKVIKWLYEFEGKVFEAEESGFSKVHGAVQTRPLFEGEDEAEVKKLVLEDAKTRRALDEARKAEIEKELAEAKKREKIVRAERAKRGELSKDEI